MPKQQARLNPLLFTVHKLEPSTLADHSLYQILDLYLWQILFYDRHDYTLFWLTILEEGLCRPLITVYEEMFSYLLELGNLS